MHHAGLFCTSGELARPRVPTFRPAGSVWGHSLCNAFGIDLPRSAARRGTRPRGSWAGRHQAEGDGPEQRPFRATRRQLDADARDVFDLSYHAGTLVAIERFGVSES